MYNNPDKAKNKDGDSNLSWNIPESRRQVGVRYQYRQVKITPQLQF